MRCRQACDGHAERRAAHVVQTCEVAELHRRRFAAVFAADAAFEVFACAAAFEYRLADQLSHAVAVEDLERVVLQNAFLQVDRQELGDVVAREAERHLRQVVGANEKNSATSAIWWAVTAARGTSIIVPTMYSRRSLRSEKTFSAVWSMMFFW